jgi:hypothetical protein
MKSSCSCYAAFLLFAMPLAHAQTTAVVPVPAQFATAQTVFLGAAGAPALGNQAKVATGMVYESMYLALTSMKRYRLAAAPADSDLAMEVSMVAVGKAGNQFNSVSMRLTVYDTKTHALLWIIDEPVDGAFLERTFQNNVNDATSRIVADLNVLASGTIPGDSASPQPKKARMSQEKP